MDAVLIKIKGWLIMNNIVKNLEELFINQVG
jgi:hypothetical protein